MVDTASMTHIEETTLGAGSFETSITRLESSSRLERMDSTVLGGMVRSILPLTWEIINEEHLIASPTMKTRGGIRMVKTLPFRPADRREKARTAPSSAISETPPHVSTVWSGISCHRHQRQTGRNQQPGMTSEASKAIFPEEARRPCFVCRTRTRSGRTSRSGFTCGQPAGELLWTPHVSRQAETDCKC